MVCLIVVDSYFFFFNDTATPEIYTLSLHDALPISHPPAPVGRRASGVRGQRGGTSLPARGRRDARSHPGRRRRLGAARARTLARRATGLRPAHWRDAVRRPPPDRAGSPDRRRGRAFARLAGDALRDPGALALAAPAPRGGARAPCQRTRARARARGRAARRPARRVARARRSRARAGDLGRRR